MRAVRDTCSADKLMQSPIMGTAACSLVLFYCANDNVSKNVIGFATDSVIKKLQQRETSNNRRGEILLSFKVIWN